MTYCSAGFRHSLIRNSWPLLLVILAVFHVSPACAGPILEVGAGVQSGWSNHDHLQNPTGWSIYATKTLSSKAALRVSFTDFSNTHRYIGTLSSGFVPYVDSLQNRLIQSDFSMQYLELAFHHQVVESGPLRLDAGAGFGLAEFGAVLTDVGYGYGYSPSQRGVMATAMVSFSVHRLFNTPLAMRLGYQYRTSPAVPVEPTDSGLLYSTDGLSMSAVTISLLAAI